MVDLLKKTKCSDLSGNTAKVEEKVVKNPEGRKATAGTAKETTAVEAAVAGEGAGRTLLGMAASAAEEGGSEAAASGTGMRAAAAAEETVARRAAVFWETETPAEAALAAATTATAGAGRGTPAAGATAG
jgi:hypothetical protein